MVYHGKTGTQNKGGRGKPRAEFLLPVAKAYTGEK
jgi:hypothetical protein